MQVQLPTQPFALVKDANGRYGLQTQAPSAWPLSSPSLAPAPSLAPVAVSAVPTPVPIGDAGIAAGARPVPITATVVGTEVHPTTSAFLGASAPSGSAPATARLRAQIGQQVPRSSSTALAARGGDEEEEEDEEDDYEFAGGVFDARVLKIGQKMDGVVVNIRDFGAFVDFGAETQGLVPKSKLADKFVENVEDVVAVGDNVNVWVSDLKNGKVTLSMTPNRIYSPGGGPKADLTLFEGASDTEWTTGTVVSVMNFGAFVQVQVPSSELMAQGLVHISQMAEQRVEDPNKVVSIGDEVKVRVISVDANANKLGLSMREKKAGGGGGGPADVSAFSEISDEEWLEGTVKGIVNFGAFVEVTAPGGAPVQGLVHLSQIRDGYVEDAGEELEMDQEVKVRVIGVDSAKGKVSFSMKEKQGSAQPEAQEEPEAQEA